MRIVQQRPQCSGGTQLTQTPGRYLSDVGRFVPQGFDQHRHGALILDAAQQLHHFETNPDKTGTVFLDKAGHDLSTIAQQGIGRLQTFVLIKAAKLPKMRFGRARATGFQPDDQTQQEQAGTLLQHG